MKEVRNPKVPLITEVYSSDDVLLGTFSVERRTPITFEEIDTNTINALIATEDIRFYKHHGLDLYALFSAAFSTAKGNKRGGSTITNQLVKNIYKTRGKRSIGLMGYIPVVRTLIAKIKEWVTAIKIEFVYDKEEILTLYFNAVEYGNNTFGLKSASAYYFQKEPIELALEESALLVGILKGPSYYNPKSKPERALDRRNTVLAQMAKYNFIDSMRLVKTSKKKLELRIKEVKVETGLAPYFMAAVKRDLKDWCEENKYNLYTDGLKIKTTLNYRIHKHAETAVLENMRYIQQAFNAGLHGQKTWFDKKVIEERKELGLKGTAYRGGQVEGQLAPTELRLIKLLKQTKQFKSYVDAGVKEWEALQKMYEPHKMELFDYGKPKARTYSTVDSLKHMLQLLQCGLISIEAESGAVKAWVGGLNFKHFEYDHVDQAKRQPGSAFKPIVYTQALLSGIDPCTTLVDEPVDYTVIENGQEMVYTPQNSDRRFTYGPVKLRRALALSKNSIALKLMKEVDPENVVSLAQRMGIESALDPNLSLALGSDEVTLRELSQAYTVFVNRGLLVPVRLVESISDYNGKLISNFVVGSKSKRIIDEETAYKMTFLLRGTVEESGGTARRLLSYGLAYDGEIGGKTGTSNDYADGWFVGITPGLITGVWVGADDMRIRFTNSNGQGGRTALPIFGRFMQLVYSDKSTGVSRGKFSIPPGDISSLNCYPAGIYIAPDTTVLGDSMELLIDSTSQSSDSLQNQNEAVGIDPDEVRIDAP